MSAQPTNPPRIRYDRKDYDRWLYFIYENKVYDVFLTKSSGGSAVFTFSGDRPNGWPLIFDTHARFSFIVDYYIDKHNPFYKDRSRSDYGIFTWDKPHDKSTEFTMPGDEVTDDMMGGKRKSRRRRKSRRSRKSRRYLK